MIPETAWSERSTCAICGSQKGRTERKIERFAIRRCVDCGFLQTEKILAEGELEDYYTKGYGGLRQRQGQEINASINIDAMRRMGLLESKKNKVLDVGCGYGYLLGRLEGVAQIRAGLELAITEIEHARDAYGIEVATAFDDLPDDLQGDFDMIVLFEVIEHIRDPVEFLNAIVARLRPGGVLVVGTDNFKSWPVRTLGDHFPKWIPHQHISLFDPVSIEELISRLDCMQVIARLSYTPWELLLRSFIYQVTGSRLGGKEFGLDDELTSENVRPFPLFSLRRRINHLWFRMSARKDLSGEMMFLAAQRGK